MAAPNPEGNDKQPSSDPNLSSASTLSTAMPRTIRADNHTETPMAPACAQCRGRKIRCDRGQPNCSNCRKAGSVCDFSNRSRRVSHTKQLVNDFSSLSSRLKSIDESFAKLTRHMLNAVPLAASPTPQSTLQEPEYLDLFHSVLNSNAPRSPTGSTSYQDVLRPMSHMVDKHGNELYYGSTAPLSLFEASRQKLKLLILEDNGQSPSKPDGAIDIGLLLASNPAFKSKLETQYDKFPFSHNYCEPVDVDGDSNANADGGAVASPPKGFLDATLDCFLREINAIYPIFDEAKLRQSINLHYCLEQHERSESKNLCFNNIIILALTAQLRKAPASAAGNSMEKEFLRSFLSNTSRALRKLDAFGSSSLLNTQALITLVLVAREHFAHPVAETLCHQVCHNIRVMGLQQASVLDANLAKCDIEREGVYWTLYIMDKQRAFMTGHPCDLYLFDSDLNLLITNNSSRIHKLHLARVHLMAICEEIHINLYSQRAILLGTLQDQEKVAGRLFGLLRKWTSQYGNILSETSDEDPSPASYLQIEIKYCFHVAQVLILRHSNTTSNASLCTYARAALMVILDTYRTGPTIGSMCLLARIFRNYPAVAFLELYQASFGVSAPQLAANLQLLSNCSDVLASIKDNPHSQRAYYTRLHLGLTWFTDNLSYLMEATESRHQRLETPVPSEPTTSALQKENSGSYDAFFAASSLGSPWDARCDSGPFSFFGNAKSSTTSTSPFTSLNGSNPATPNSRNHSLEQYLAPELSDHSNFDVFSAVNFPTQFGTDCNGIDMTKWDINPDAF